MAEALRAGNRATLARAITLAESGRDDAQKETFALLRALGPLPPACLVIGITGAPGVGKSSLIEKLGLQAIAQNRKVAVLAVDPTSPVAGGSILGDKTRMNELAAHPQAFVRPSPSGTALGGLHDRAYEVIRILAAAGFDLIFLETVGVGQSEIAVSTLADLTLLLLQPGGGDELQGLKKGIMEIADLIAVTKMDGAQKDLVDHAISDYRRAVGLARNSDIAITGISSLTGEGIDDLFSRIAAKAGELAAKGALPHRRQAREAAWFKNRMLDAARRALLDDALFLSLYDEIESGRRDALEALSMMGKSYGAV